MLHQKLILSSCFFMLFFVSISAQDYIYLLNGDTIKAKVTSLESEAVYYSVPYYKPNGDTYRLLKTEIDRVKMFNGTEVFFNRLAKSTNLAGQTKNEIVAKKAREKKALVSAQKLNRRGTDVMYPMNFLIYGGITTPGESMSSFDKGYTLGLEYSNYYNSHIGFVGHISATANQLDYSDSSNFLSGELINSWLMVGGKLGTGTSLSPIRLYIQGIAGVNYMLPANGLEVVKPTLNFAYGGGGGLVIADLIHLGVRYQYAYQKVETASRSSVLGSSYMSLVAGVQF